MQKFCRKLKAFEADTRGNVTIISGLALTMLMAFASLGAEYGAGLLLQSENQRIADSAAFIATTYCGANSGCSTTAALNTATAIAQNIGALNGIPAADVTPAIVASGAEVQIKVSTTKFLMITPIEGAPNFLSLTALSYGQIGAAENVSADACIVSLSAITGISLSGGVSLSAPTCGVATNNTLTVPCGTHLTASTISYDTTAPTVGCSNMTPATAVKAAVTDPLAGTPQVIAAEGRLSAVTAMTNPTAPTVTVSAASGGTTFPISGLGWSPTNTVSAGGCTATWNSGTSVWSISGCPAGTYNINTAIVNGPGMNFMPGGSSSSVYNFNVAVNTNYTTSSFGPGTYNFLQAVTASGTTAFGVVSTTGGVNSFVLGTGTNNFNFGSTLTTAGTTVFGAGNFNFAQGVTVAGTTIFGAATAPASGATIATSTFATPPPAPSAPYTYNFAKGLTAGGGATTAFGYGTFNFGPTSASCTGGYAYSICNTSTLLTFEGSSAYPSTFTLSNGIYSGGGTVLSMGAGSTNNSFNIGKAGDGNALNFGGGPTVTFGDATCTTGCVFQLNGNLVNAGGSCTIISAAAEHDINGSMNVQGGTVLGTGVYTLAGYFGAGINAGGAVTCTIPNYNGTTSASSQSVGVYGYGVTITYGADAIAYTSGGLSYGFYVSAGFTDFTLLAPTSSSAATENLAVAGPLAGGTAAGVFFGAGASNAIVSGAMYSPTGAFYMSGGASVGNGANGCLEIVANTVTLTGGTAVASSCITAVTGTSSSSSTGATPKIVQ